MFQQSTLYTHLPESVGFASQFTTKVSSLLLKAGSMESDVLHLLIWHLKIFDLNKKEIKGTVSDKHCDKTIFLPSALLFFQAFCLFLDHSAAKFSQYIHFVNSCSIKYIIRFNEIQ